MRSFSLPAKGLLVVGLPLVGEILLVLILALSLRQAEHEAYRETHARAIRIHASELENLVQQATASSVMYCKHGHENYKTAALELTQKLPSEMEKLRALAREDPGEVRIVERMGSLVNLIVSGIEKSMQQRQFEPLYKFQPYDIYRFGRELNRMSYQLTYREARLTPQEVERHNFAREQLKVVILGGLIVNVLIALVSALFFMRNIVARLQTVLQNVSLLPQSRPLKMRLRGTDEIARLDGAFHEMTEQLARNSRREQAIVERARDVIWAARRDGTICKINVSSLGQWGFTPEELVGRSLFEIVEPTSKDTSQKELNNLLTTGSAELTLIIRHKDGRVIYTLSSITWSPEDEMYFCVSRDISEQKRLEQLKQQFAAMVSHDLRTPLNSVQASLSLASNGVFGELDAKGARLLSSANVEIGRLINLVNGLLDMERLESGMMPLDREIAVSSIMIDQALNAVAALAEKKGITVDRRILEKEIVCDSARIVQVLVNLLSNAIKYSPRETTIQVCVEMQGRELEFSVIDSGRGVKEEYRSKIFDRFQQVELSDSRIQGGSGLGLAISKAIVESHGGAIGVAAGPDGKGSIFWFRLPISGSDDEIES